jgi:hypothetical protein
MSQMHVLHLITKTIRLMLLREIVALFPTNHQQIQSMGEMHVSVMFMNMVNIVTLVCLRSRQGSRRTWTWQLESNVLERLGKTTKPPTRMAGKLD